MNKIDESVGKRQELLVSKYNAISLYLKRFRLSEMDEEDVLQDTFVIAYKKLHTLKDISKLEIWLRRIAERVAFNLIKEKSMQALPSSEIERLSGDGKERGVFDEGFDNVCKEESKAELYKKIEALSPKFYNVINLHYIQERSLHETAEILGINYNTAKTLHARALKKLKTIKREKGAHFDGYED